MASFNFYLREPKSKTETPITLKIIDRNKSIKIPTGLKIRPSCWDRKKQNVKTTFLRSLDYNIILNHMITKYEKAYYQLIISEIPFSLKDLRKSINKKIYFESQFFEQFDNFIEAKSTKITYGTLQKYKTLKNHLIAFSKKEDKPLRFMEINFEFYDRFSSFLISNLKLTNNTHGKYISNLKVFLNWCNERGLNPNKDYIKFPILKEKTDIIYLTEEELFRLYNYSFNKKYLDNAKEFFCFACFTGQRFSDIAKISKNDIKNDTWILMTQKTKDIIEVPLNKYALNILKSNKNYSQPLHIISNQKLNKYLKEIGKIIGLNSKEKRIRFRGAERIEEILPKYELITSHTARRTFITLSLQKGMRAETLMEITGHKDYDTFKKYIKITSDVTKNEMKRIWN